MLFSPKLSTLLSLILLFVGGCTDDLESITEISKNRVLGARYVADGDATQAWAQPGVTGEVRWFVVDEAQSRPLTYVFAVCPRLPVGTQPVCGGPPFSVIMRTEPSIDPPVARFTTPNEIGDTLQLLVLGIVCADGQAKIDLENLDASCVPIAGTDGPPQGTPVVFSLPIERDGRTNRQPQMGDDFVSLLRDGASEPWTEPIEVRTAGEPCRDLKTTTALPRVARADAEAIEIAFASTDDNFETYIEGGQSLRETISVSAFGTLGEIDRSLTSLSSEMPTGDVEWKPPAENDPDVSVMDEGIVGVFYFVARDGRAGAQISERHLCLIP